MGWMGRFADGIGTLDVSRIEESILLSQYDDAATVSAALLPRLLQAGPEIDAVLQRALVLALQGYMQVGRQQEAESFIERMGVHRLAVPTFLVWVLLLLESGQAPAARQRVEQYMSAVAAATAGKHTRCQEAHHQIPYSPCATATEPAAGPLTGTAVSPGGEAALGSSATHLPGSSSCGPGPCSEAATTVSHACNCPGLGPPTKTGAAAATLQDRAALARLYSQDVLALGLGLPGVALAWLQLPTPSPPSQQPQQPQQPEQPEQRRHRHQHDHPSAHTQRRSGECSAPQPLTAAGGALVSAAELIDDEGTVQQLCAELEDLLETRGIRVAAPARCPPAGGMSGAAKGAERGAHAAAAAAQHGPLDKPAGAGVVVSDPSVHSRAHAVATAAGGSGSVAAAASAPGVAFLQRSRLAAPLPGARVLAALRGWLAAAAVALRSLACGAAARLSRAQAWAVCRAAAAAARLRATAAEHFPAGPGFLPLLLAGLLLLAAAAEAPHLRQLLARQLGGLAGMVREAVWMGLALHPKPVASAPRAMP